MRDEDKTKDDLIAELQALRARVAKRDTELSSGLSERIAEHESGKEALRRSEEQYRSIFENAATLIASVDQHGIILDCNRRARELLGYERAEMIGRPITRILDPEDLSKMLKSLAKILSEGSAHNEEYRMVHRDGTRIDVVINSSALKNREGVCDRTIWIVEDITDRKQAEEEKRELLDQLHQAQKMEAIGQLAAGVAHDFNNLLTIIFANADLIASEVPKHMLPSGSLEMIQQAAEQASDVTRALLTFSRKVPCEKKRIDLCHTIEKTTCLLSRMLPASIEITADIPCDSPIWVNADTTQIQQVVMNLGINARDAMPNGGELRVSLSRHTETAGGESAEKCKSEVAFARLVISDTGVGMPPEVLLRIFEPFFTTKNRGQGTGLGLSIIHGIVKGHAGTINVESVVGQGTTFTILLPRVEEAASPTGQGRRKSSPTGQGETIVLAEDNKYVSRIIATTLEALSYQVIQAETGPSLIECVEQHGDQIRLFIIDVDLPKRSGLDSLQHLRAGGNQAPAIIITGEMDPDLKKQLDQGSVLLRKPFEMAALAHLVSRLCGSSRHSGEPA